MIEKKLLYESDPTDYRMFKYFIPILFLPCMLIFFLISLYLIFASDELIFSVAVATATFIFLVVLTPSSYTNFKKLSIGKIFEDGILVESGFIPWLSISKAKRRKFFRVDIIFSDSGIEKKTAIPIDRTASGDMKVELDSLLKKYLGTKYEDFFF